jgi:nucleoside-diphosphate-sugar epimerase
VTLHRRLRHAQRTSGATGGIGGEIARQMRDAGWEVRAMKRGVEGAPLRDGITWVGGDSMSGTDVRGGDFFGAHAGNSWFAQGLVKPGLPVKTVYRPAQAGVGHEWSYLPDVARTVVELLDKGDALESFATFHMAGHWDSDGSRMTDAIRRVVARRTGVEPRVAAFPWWLLTVAAPFVTTFREMREMRYLWRNSLRMDNARLAAVLGREPHTPLEAAVEATLAGLGCLASAAAPSRNGSGSTAPLAKR